ncbi:MAG: isochorismatase family protein [Phenylobacterium sp.]
MCLDLQRAFLERAGGAGALCVANCRRVLTHARRSGWSIVHVFSRDGSRPIEDLEPLPSEPVFYRPGVSAFSSRDFDELAGASGDARMVVIGFSLTSSCLATALAAYDRSLRPILVEDAVAATRISGVADQAVEAVARAIAAPFVDVVATDSLIGPLVNLRLVRT